MASALPTERRRGLHSNPLVGKEASLKLDRWNASGATISGRTGASRVCHSVTAALPCDSNAWYVMRRSESDAVRLARKSARAADVGIVAWLLG